MSQVCGGDGISFAAHVVLNDLTLVGAVSDSWLPGYVRYINFGFESLSMQNDPSAP